MNEDMNSPKVTSIKVDYSDGSSDIFNLLQEGEFTLYDMIRNKPNEEVISSGAHSGGAIAGLLFITAVTGKYTDRKMGDKRIIALHKAWMQEKEKNP